MSRRCYFVHGREGERQLLHKNVEMKYADDEEWKMEDGRLVHTLRLTAGGKASKSLSRGGSIFGGGSASFRLSPLCLGKTLRD